MIRLVASDMDGTLLGKNGAISERTAEVVHQLQARDVDFLVCTGRGYLDAKLPLEKAGILCDMICMNGAAIYDKFGRQIYKKPLKKEQLLQILEFCEGRPVVLDFMTDKGSCTISGEEEMRQAFHEGYLLPMAAVESFEHLKQRFSFTKKEDLFRHGNTVYKMSIMSRDPETLTAVRRELYENVDDLAVVSSDATNLEITHIEAQKGTALIHYALYRGIGLHEIMALGDSENDHSMLSLQLGYTLSMENGADIVKKTARCQTRSNEEDGVAYAIETLILSQPAQKARRLG